MRLPLVAATGALMLGLLGCSDDDAQRLESTKATPTSTEQLVDLVRDTVSHDHEPAASPQALRESSDLVEVGRVVSVSGALAKEPAGPSTGLVLIEVELEKAWTPQVPRIVTLQLRRPTNVPAEEYQQGLPEGATVAVFATVSQIAMEEPLPDGSPGYVPQPQGFLVEVADGNLVSLLADSSAEYPQWATVRTIGDLEDSLGPTEPMTR